MRRRSLLVGVVLFLLALGGLSYTWSRFSLSALDEPGRVETFVATKAKHWLVARSARGQLSRRPADRESALFVGDMQFSAHCASCHGRDGRTPTDTGRWMYPRVLDLGSPQVQQWSDEELFWIIRHGIRLSGMPGFGKSLSDEDIWSLVYYVRQVGDQKKK